MIDANAIAQMMQQYKQQGQQGQQPAVQGPQPLRNVTDPASYAGGIRDRLAAEQASYFANPQQPQAQPGGGVRDMTTLLAKLQGRGGFMGGMAGAMAKMRGDGSIRDQLAAQQQAYLNPPQQAQPPAWLGSTRGVMNRKGGAGQPPAPQQ